MIIYGLCVNLVAHSSIRRLLSTYHVPGTVLEAADTKTIERQPQVVFFFFLIPLDLKSPERVEGKTDTYTHSCGSV